MAQISLTYSVEPPPKNLAPAAVASKLGAVDLFQGELEQLGMVDFSDVVAVVSGVATRTVVLETTPAGDANFPTDEAKVYATKNLYTQALALGVPGPIVAADPVVLP